MTTFLCGMFFTSSFFLSFNNGFLSMKLAI